MSTKPNGKSDKPLTFEQAQEQLESIVRDLEEGRLPLAEALARYESGVKLLGQCYGILEQIEQKIELLSGLDADGNPITSPFDDEATPERKRRNPKSNRRPVATDEDRLELFE